MTAPIPRDIPDLPAIPGIPALPPSSVPASAVVTPVRRPLTAVFRLLTALAAAAAVTLALLEGDALPTLSLFSVQAAILLTLTLLPSARRAWTARRPLPSALTGAILLYVTVGALVHRVLLTDPSTPYADTTPLAAPTSWQTTLAAHLLHTAIPIAALLDWLLLTAPGRLHLRQASTWLLYPLAYLTFTLTRGELLAPGTPGRYLYPFLDVAAHGYKSTLGNALLLGLSCYALAVLLVTLDHLRPNPIRHRPKTGFRLQPPVG
ncbi:Pr6Pr family membrane protein [Streptomyces broussonetiae]|uniref:Pr6Pr family membrane protein n=1 Tax=Streptomyces broussonetiae TaxID=2686304 RepID=A0ABV5EEX7_9ACTN